MHKLILVLLPIVTISVIYIASVELSKNEIGDDGLMKLDARNITNIPQYFRWRNYSPQIGSFLQRDPMQYEIDCNLYSYAKNMPQYYVDPMGEYVEACFAYAEKRILAYDSDDDNNNLLEVNNVFSGNGENANNIESQHLVNQGPIPLGRYWIGEKRNTSGYQGHNHYPKGNWNWYRLYGADGKGGMTYNKIPVNYHGNVYVRGGLNLHTGRESNGCVTVRSEVDKIGPDGAINENYPQSTDFDKLSEMLDRTKPFMNPRNKNDKYLGKLTVVECIKECGEPFISRGVKK